MIKHFIAAATLLAVGASASASNLVTNGSFETGDFTGWTLGGNNGFIQVSQNFGGVAATDGVYEASFGAVGSDTTLSQQLTVDPTGLYTVSFDLDDLSGGGPQDFAASLGGTTLVSYASQPFGSYTHLSFTAEGGDGSLSFAFRQDPSYWLIDNISVTAAVPESSTPAMLLAGLALVGFAARRRAAR